VLRAHLYEDKQAEADASVNLSEGQKRETLALMDATSESTRRQIGDVIARHTSDLDGVSPAGRLRQLSTPVYLLHGQADNIIPSAETLWMASELPSDDLKAVLVSPVLSHIDFGSNPGVWDQWHLIHFFALVLDATERR
jgi:pimeloyl-ACP methyl ester carboxylesterase